MSGNRPDKTTAKKWTILEAVKAASEYLKKRELPTARLDAELLLAHILDTDRIDLYIKYDRPLDDKELRAYRKALTRRANHEPVAYITGRKEFWSLELYVDQRVMIPRPESEHVVERALAAAQKLQKGNWKLRILDLGTGSGALAIALSKELNKKAVVIASDISMDAIKVAAINKDRHQRQNLLLFCGDLMEAISTDTKFDIIICNPPYVSEEEMKKLPREVAAFEPEIALRGGANGLDFYRLVLPQAAARLSHGGRLIMEIGEGQHEEVAKIARKAGFSLNPNFFKDLAGIIRVVEFEKP